MHNIFPSTPLRKLVVKNLHPQLLLQSRKSNENKRLKNIKVY